MPFTSLTPVAISRVAMFVALVLPATAIAQPATATVPAPGGAAARRSVMLLDLDFTCDGSAVVTVGDAVRVFDVATGALLQKFDVPKHARYVAGSPVSKELFAAGADDGVIRLYRIGEEQPVHEWNGHGQLVGDLCFSPDGAQLVSCSMTEVDRQHANCNVRQWDVESGRLLNSLDIEDDPISCIAISDDGQHLALARGPAPGDPTATAYAELYAVHEWRLVRSVPFEPGFAMALDFTPDGSKLLIAGGICVPTQPDACRPTGKLWVADLNDEGPARRLEVQQSGYFRSAGIAPSGDLFAAGTAEVRETPRVKMMVGMIQMRQLGTGKVVWSRDGAVGDPYGVTVARDGSLVAGCTSRQVQILKASTGEPVTTIDIAE